MSDDWPTPAPADDALPTAEEAPAASGPDRRDRFVEVMRLEGLAAAATSRAQTLRDQLAAEALDEYLRTRAAPTWRMSDLGTASLPISQETTVVSDLDALLRWVRERHPENVRVVEEITPAFQGWLIANCLRSDGGVVVHPETGEVVPGLSVRPGGQPRTLSFRPETGVKYVFAKNGESLLDEILGGG